MDYNGPVIDPFLNLSTLFVYNFYGVHHLIAGFEGFLGILPQSSQTNVYAHPVYGTYRLHVRSHGHGLNFQIGYRMQIFRTENWDLGED
jgi:hypothetical protein